MVTLSRIFIKGLALLTPILGTLLIVSWLFSSIEGLSKNILESWIPQNRLFPGAGILFSLVLIFCVGILAHLWFFKSLFGKVEKLLNKAPLVRAIYGSLRDFSDFVYPADSGKKKLGRSVIVHIEKLGLSLVGFEMVSDLKDHKLGEAVTDSSNKVVVYLPMSYQIGGYMAIVDRGNLQPLNLTSEETLRLTITAGVTGKTER